MFGLVASLFFARMDKEAVQEEASPGRAHTLESAGAMAQDFVKVAHPGLLEESGSARSIAVC